MKRAVSKGTAGAVEEDHMKEVKAELKEENGTGCGF